MVDKKIEQMYYMQEGRTIVLFYINVLADLHDASGYGKRTDIYRTLFADKNDGRRSIQTGAGRQRQQIMVLLPDVDTRCMYCT